MPAILTPLTNTTDWQCRNTASTPKVTLQRILDKHKDVFKGIALYKYEKVKLLIDETVEPIAQPQWKIPFAKWSQLDLIFDELEASHAIKPVETNWITNLVLTLKADPTQIRMNVVMTTLNVVISCTRHVIPTLRELQYQLDNKMHFTKLDMSNGYM